MSGRVFLSSESVFVCPAQYHLTLNEWCKDGAERACDLKVKHGARPEVVMSETFHVCILTKPGAEQQRLLKATAFWVRTFEIVGPPAAGACSSSKKPPPPPAKRARDESESTPAKAREAPSLYGRGVKNGAVATWACEQFLNFDASYLGRFPVVSADFWTSDHLSERSRSVGAFSGTRARGTRTLKRC